MKLSTLELARSTGKRPRLHPNGFIQLDLNEYTRLHVWPDEKLPAQKTRHTVHDHVFDMVSVVLRGTMHNHVYHWSENKSGKYAAHRADDVIITTGLNNHKRVEDTVLRPTGEVGDLVELHTDIVTEGNTYYLPAFYLHDSEADGLTATLMTKTRVYKDRAPLVAVPRDVEPDNDFRRETIGQEPLWSWIEKALA
jgi:hypothetical protein